jgi:uncharacterized Ntn-hydrolase superfamily protein
MGVSTFSIVGYDQTTGDLGIAVASRFPSVGAVVPWAAPGVGAVAVQALPGPQFGPRGLRLLTDGRTPEQTVAELLSGDGDAGLRQIGVVAADGRAASYTGSGCDDWAGGVSGDGYAAQGNILAGPRVVGAMEETYLQADGPLAERLLQALAAGEDAGGDGRGRQAAALLVVRVDGGYLRSSDRYVDLRSDDHPTPIAELRRLLAMHRLLFEPPRAEDLIPIDEPLTRELQGILARAGVSRRAGDGAYDTETRAALRYLFGCENLEERWREDNTIDAVALSRLRARFAEGS